MIGIVVCGPIFQPIRVHILCYNPIRNGAEYNFILIVGDNSLFKRMCPVGVVMPGVTHDTLHTQPQLIPPPCFILSIVQRISPGLLKIFYTSKYCWSHCLGCLSESVFSIHFNAPTERTLRFNLKCSVYGSVVVCLSIAINMLQIFYTFSFLINAQNRNSAHADHLA